MALFLWCAKLQNKDSQKCIVRMCKPSSCSAGPTWRAQTPGPPRPSPPPGARPPAYLELGLRDRKRALEATAANAPRTGAHGLGFTFPPEAKALAGLCRVEDAAVGSQLSRRGEDEGVRQEVENRNRAKVKLAENLSTKAEHAAPGTHRRPGRNGCTCWPREQSTAGLFIIVEA